MKLVFETMAAAPGGVLFHCTYGRDRSGVVAALLLRALGVSRADVMADYSRTAANGLGGTPPSLEAVLDELDRTGGARGRLGRMRRERRIVERARHGFRALTDAIQEPATLREDGEPSPASA